MFAVKNEALLPFKEEIQDAKLKFLAIMQNEDKAQEFKEVLSLSDKYFQLSNPLSSYLENYWRFQDLFANEKFEPTKNFNALVFPKDHPVIYRFLDPLNPRMRGDNMREVPSSVVHQLLRFYATFVAAGSPIEVPFIPPIVREMVATGLLDLTCDRTVSITVFDKIAEIAIESLFCRCFQKYLMIKGANIPSLKEVLQAHKDWEIVNMQDQFAKSTISDSSPRQSTEIGREKEKQKSKNSSSMNLWDKMKGMGKKDKIKLKHTRDCMVEVLQNPKYYAMFSQFVKETHCEENLVCFESFLKLESRSRQRPDNMIPLSLERFLDTNVEDEDKDTPIPVVLAPLYMFFDQMFVKPESPFEVNVTHTLRKSIDVQLRNIKNSMIPISIFDPVIDHVLELLYVNSFLLFIKSRADE